MGQRVNIIIVSEQRTSDKTNKHYGQVRVQVFHDQWGIGRKTFLNVITAHNYIYNLPYGSDALDLELNTPNIHKEYEFLYEDGKSIAAKPEHEFEYDKTPSLETFYTPKGIADFIDEWCDNNNGAVVIYVTSNDEPYNHEVKIRVGWILGWEDCAFYGTKEEDGTRTVKPKCEGYGYTEEEWRKYYGNSVKFGVPGDLFLSAEEYAGLDINKDYADEKFMKFVKEFFEFFEIDDLGIPDEDGTDKVVPVPTYEK